MYRDGGGSRGIDLSVRIVKEGIKKLNKGGLLILYTGMKSTTQVVRTNVIPRSAHSKG